MSDPSDAFVDLPGDADTGLLLIADHASNRVPADIVLGVLPERMGEHVAIDIGVDPLGRALCGALGCPGVLGGISRLVLDLNREEAAAGLIPEASDGHAVPGNVGLDAGGREARIARFWHPYHTRIAALIATGRPRLLISLHSFTSQLASAPGETRPWEVGILYNRDERAARVALPMLAAAGVVVGDNLPYSGRVLNATMNRHGEANGIAYLGLEVRQDLIGGEAGVARWCGVLVPVIRGVLQSLA